MVDPLNTKKKNNLGAAIQFKQKLQYFKDFKVKVAYFKEDLLSHSFKLNKRQPVIIMDILWENDSGDPIFVLNCMDPE